MYTTSHRPSTPWHKKIVPAPEATKSCVASCAVGSMASILVAAGLATATAFLMRQARWSLHRIVPISIATGLGTFGLLAINNCLVGCTAQKVALKTWRAQAYHGH